MKRMMTWIMVFCLMAAWVLPVQAQEVNGINALTQVSSSEPSKQPSEDSKTSQIPEESPEASSPITPKEPSEASSPVTQRTGLPRKYRNRT